MEKLYINWEESIKELCQSNWIPFPINNLSAELKEILVKYTIIFENWFWNLNRSHLIWIFRDLKNKKILRENNSLKVLIANRILEIKNTEFQEEELTLSQNISFINCKWESLKISKNIIDKKLIQFNWNRLIKKLEFYDFIWESEIYIDNNSKINNLGFINFNTNWVINIRVKCLQSLKIINSHLESKKINFFNIEIKWTTDILDSDLGETKFNWIIFKKLKLRNSSFFNVTFNWCLFPPSLEDFKNNNKQKDNYRQLKFLMDKNWNYTEASKFYALEMEYYEKSLGLEKMNIYSIFKRIHKEGYRWENTKKYWEQFVLKFSKWVNNFWNNWIRPAFLLFLFAFLATIVDWVSTGLWEKYWNIQWDLFTILGFFLIIVIDYKTSIFKNPWDKIDKLMDHIIWFFILLSVTFMLLDMLVLKSWLASLSLFSNYINPIWVLPEYTIIGWDKIYLHYNGIELFSFVLYKVFYWIILWHLIVAAKRTTKR